MPKFLVILNLTYIGSKLKERYDNDKSTSTTLLDKNRSGLLFARYNRFIYRVASGLALLDLSCFMAPNRRASTLNLLPLASASKT